MALRPSCRGCRHCVPPSNGGQGWCRLRQLPIHAELAGELWCHHWTARAPRLPTFSVHAQEVASPRNAGPQGCRQLSLDVVQPS